MESYLQSESKRIKVPELQLSSLKWLQTNEKCVRVFSDQALVDLGSETTILEVQERLIQFLDFQMMSFQEINDYTTLTAKSHASVFNLLLKIFSLNETPKPEWYEQLLPLF
jgi:hypothetical protein